MIEELEYLIGAIGNNKEALECLELFILELVLTNPERDAMQKLVAEARAR